jgi:hypothetical protein
MLLYACLLKKMVSSSLSPSSSQTALSALLLVLCRLLLASDPMASLDDETGDRCTQKDKDYREEECKIEKECFYAADMAIVDLGAMGICHCIICFDMVESILVASFHIAL